jgi:hypothetical protein
LRERAGREGADWEGSGREDFSDDMVMYVGRRRER